MSLYQKPPPSSTLASVANTQAPADKMAYAVPGPMSNDDKVMGLIARCQAGDLGPSQCDYLCLVILKQRKEAKVLRLHCSMVGFDPENRQKAGGSSTEVQPLVEDIQILGFNWDEVKHALCAEVPPNDSKVEEFNRQWVEGATVEMAPVEKGSIRYGALACGHTNQGLRCIHARVACDNPKLGDDGHYDVDVIEKKDPLMAQAVREGLEWTVLSWQCRYLYPGLFATLQEARNAGSHVARAAHELSGLLHVHELWARQINSKETLDYAALTRAMVRSKPPYQQDLEHFFYFVAA